MKKLFAILFIAALFVSLSACEGQTADYSPLDEIVGTWNMQFDIATLTFTEDGRYILTSHRDNISSENGVYAFDAKHDLLMMNPFGGSLVFNLEFSVNSEGKEYFNMINEAQGFNIRFTKAD